VRIHDGRVTEAEDQEYRDALPADLDVSAYVGPYTFPDNKRRRIPGLLYIASGLALVLAWALAGSDAVLVNRGSLIAGISLIAIGLYCVAAAYPLAVDEVRALASAARQVGFAVGHASAQLGWRGLRSRPTWRILLYSADEPPSQRGLVLVDGVDGAVVDALVEPNPEDWSAFTA
jgi:hypothetical protein